ncbi:alpha/beta fold hydrolase [Nonomuraea terrae]|uniref:alpha/beta fold hydrolase n=1 Tax=Nonomuraea terrae TaxID=2530383 RepID=UPI00378955A7
MLALHGAFGRGRAWMTLVEHLGPDWRVIGLDQRGHGLSDEPGDYGREASFPSKRFPTPGALRSAIGEQVLGFGSIDHFQENAFEDDRGWGFHKQLEATLDEQVSAVRGPLSVVGEPRSSNIRPRRNPPAGTVGSGPNSYVRHCFVNGGTMGVAIYDVDFVGFGEQQRGRRTHR